MTDSAADRHGPRRARRAWLAGAALIAGALVAIATAPRAQSPDERPYPHGKFRADCALCHDPKAWLPARPGKDFDHAKFGFPLVGAHRAAGCRSCHSTLDFTQQRTLCVSCHQDVHRGEMGADCARCHTARSFIDRAAMVRAHQLTRFPLAGRHSGLDCESCHPPAPSGHMQFVGTRADCASCHMDLYRSVRDPDHVASGFPTNCSSCHTPMQWSPARFDHADTRFPLTGAHRRVPCSSCHGDGVYRGKSTDCYACHRHDYERTADPGHVAAGFPTTCASCHNTTSWQDASFDHSATAFPLTGAHTRVACSGCHGDGVYQGKSTDCYACHKSAYDGTTDPNHAAAGFPTACANCHTTASWAGATFDHDASFFPIYSGRHRGLWSDCATCHNVPNNFSQFTCFSCHPHDDKAQTDGNHSGVSGYQYTSPACYSCHPRGNAG